MTELLHSDYCRLSLPGVDAVTLTALATPMHEILQTTTLYAHAQAHPARRAFAGRGPAYAIPLGDEHAVVRHVRHGGWLAPLTGDLFLAPTRAPYELAVSHRLRELGVSTPAVLAYVTYAAAPGVRRADVVTREVPNATDLGALLALGPPAAPSAATLWAAVAVLIEDLARVGAYHADLNVKNVLIGPTPTPTPTPTPPTPDGGLRAYAIDVDRIVWGHAGDHGLVRANMDRVHRSARKRGLL